jgi:hypothetical protein
MHVFYRQACIFIWPFTSIHESCKFKRLFCALNVTWRSECQQNSMRYLRDVGYRHDISERCWISTRKLMLFSLTPQVECKDGTWQYKTTASYHALFPESPTCSPQTAWGSPGSVMRLTATLIDQLSWSSLPSFCNLSYDSYIVSFKTSYPQCEIQCLLFWCPVFLRFYKASSSCLHLFPRLPVTSIFTYTFSSITCFKMQLLRKI